MYRKNAPERLDTVYLVEVEDENKLARRVACHHEELFEQELKGWYTDPALWPRDRSLKVLKEWCSFELHTVVVDVVSLHLKTTSSKNEPCRATRNRGGVFDPHTS